MAVTHCKRRNVAVDVVKTDVTTAGIEIEAQEHGDRMILLLTAAAVTDGCTATIVAGDGEVFGGLEDLVVSFPSTGGEKAVCLDTARFKFVSGAHKGKIVVKASVADKIKATMIVAC